MPPKKLVPAPEAVAPSFEKLTAWSYSTYSTYLKCPMQICYEKVQRLRMPEESSPVLERGSMIHKNAEQVIAAAKPPEVIPELVRLADKLASYRKLKAKVEEEWAFTKDWIPTQWRNWKECWLRMKVDALAVTPGKTKRQAPPLIQITDWKSGRAYPDHAQQRSLYALGALQLIDLGVLPGDAKTKVVAEHLYVDTTQSATEEFFLKDLKSLKRQWETRIKDMMEDTTYRVQPGFHCRWCKYRASNGGPCKEEQV